MKKVPKEPTITDPTPAPAPLPATHTQPDGYSMVEREFPTLASLLLIEMKAAGALTFHGTSATEYYCEHRVKIIKNKLSVILATTGDSTRPESWCKFL